MPFFSRAFKRKNKLIVEVNSYDLGEYKDTLPRFTYLYNKLTRDFFYNSTDSIVFISKEIEDFFKKFITAEVETIETLRFLGSNNYSESSFSPLEWMMDQNEKYNNKVAFYLIAHHSQSPIDGYYKHNNRKVLNTAKNILKRGHEIGLHLGYQTFDQYK